MNDKQRFGEILVRADVLERATLDATIAELGEAAVDLGEVLVARGLIDEQVMLQTVSKALNLPSVGLEQARPDERALALVSRALCIEHLVIPIEVERSRTGEHLHLAMANPADVRAIKTVTRQARRRIRPLVASARAIRAAIDRFYGAGAVHAAAAGAASIAAHPGGAVGSVGALGVGAVHGGGAAASAGHLASPGQAPVAGLGAGASPFASPVAVASQSHIAGPGSNAGQLSNPTFAASHNQIAPHPPGHAAPGHAAPGHAAPGHAAPGHAAPGHAAPGYAAPGHAAPSHPALGPHAPLPRNALGPPLPRSSSALTPPPIRRPTPDLTEQMRAPEPRRPLTPPEPALAAPLHRPTSARATTALRRGIDADLLDALDHSALESVTGPGDVSLSGLTRGNEYGLLRRPRRPRPLDSSPEAPPAPGPGPLPPLPPGLSDRRRRPERTTNRPEPRNRPGTSSPPRPIPTSRHAGELLDDETPTPLGVIDDRDEGDRVDVRRLLDRFVADAQDDGGSADEVLAAYLERYGRDPSQPAERTFAALENALAETQAPTARLLVALVRHLARRGLVDLDELLATLDA